jgi:hypothetical protein
MEYVSWEYRCFLPRTAGVTAAALEAARLFRDAGAERRTDIYIAVDDDHGVKRRGGAGAELELKACVERRADGAERLAKTAIARVADGGWRRMRHGGGALDPSLAAVIDAGASVCVEKRRWALKEQGGMLREVTKLKVKDARWLSLCCEGGDAAAVACAGAALQQAVLEKAGLPPYAARVCSYAAWVCERAREHAAAPSR